MSEPFREEITRLEALYAGNPGGRVFTHLAEAYRKAGELDRARDILDRGLRNHGEYASAYVVLGRVLIDMGQSDEARAAFRRVIELDRHNLIALRSLGDLASEAGDTAKALRYYRELLALDPADEVLQATVARLGSSGPARESGDPAPSNEAAGHHVDSEVEPPGVGSAIWIASVDGEIEVPGADRAAEAPGVDRGAAAPGVDGAAEAPGAGRPPEAPDVEGAAAGAFGMESAAERLAVDDADAIAQPGEMVTETMAELYAAQGLHVSAAEVYRSLLLERPGDDQLAERLRQMESLIDGADEEEATGVAISAAAESDAASPADDTQGWLERVESAWTGGSGVAGAGPTPYAWTETAHTVRTEEDGEDRSISAYFESLLAWRPGERHSDDRVDVGVEIEPRATDVDAATEGDEPAVWLDETTSDSVRSEAEPVDDGGTALTPRDVRPYPTRHAARGDPGRAGTPVVEEDEDLEMFRSWLQSLKK